jgi:hypothetical protein
MWYDQHGDLPGYTFNAYRIDREKNTVIKCSVWVGPDNAASQPGCALQSDWSVNIGNSLAASIGEFRPMGATYFPNGVWFMDRGTGVVTFCNNRLTPKKCVVLNP